MSSIRENTQCAWRWLLSFTRRDWTIGDYPVKICANGQSPEPSIRYRAQIVNWPGPVGLEPTPEEAYEMLSENLEIIRARRSGMPRPGTNVRLQFAATGRVRSDPSLLDDFIQRVLLFAENAPVFISGKSSLHDFGDDAVVQGLSARVKDVYSIGVSDIAAGSGNIAEILERIGRAGDFQPRAVTIRGRS